MRLGIISDIHDHLHYLQPAIRYLSEHADRLLCLGDLCSPFVMEELRRFPGPVDIVFGNNDADLFRITKKSDERLRVHGELFEAEWDGIRVAAHHFDNIARGLAHSGLYDLVCFGHNHRRSMERVGGTLAVNPGPIMGVAFGASGWERVPASFAVCSLPGLELSTLQVGSDGQITQVS